MEIKIKEGINDLYELEKTKKLLEFTFKKNFTIDYLNWLYNKNPSGEAITYNAWSYDKIVAHYTVIPMQYKCTDFDGICGLSLNSATHTSFTGKGLFKNLADLTYQKAKSKNFSFIYGVANNQSTWIFENKLEFKNFGPLDVKIGFKNFEDISKTKFIISIVHNNKFFQWKLSNPNTNYHIIKLREDISIWKKNFIFKFLMCKLKQNEIKSETNLSSSKFFSPISIYIGNSKNFKKSKNFYINFPRVFKPSPLNLIFKNLDSKIRIFKKNLIKIDLIDFDIF
jgi:hypothetical protein